MTDTMANRTVGWPQQHIRRALEAFIDHRKIGTTDAIVIVTDILRAAVHYEADAAELLPKRRTPRRNEAAPNETAIGT